ncbi:AvrD family protein [Actinokineospora inagensis]|uniref:AvrD family protein n=1 Tax=Actinokineospora inagensis TaxID=103730 RepID=UPI000426DFD5|nr:AvrD family protein [Actinokineospora inagensis]
MAARELLAPLRLGGIEEVLGPAAGRFFGAGYRRADYTVADVVLPGTPDEDATAVVDMTYPADWSRKKTGVDLRPHLSSVDILVLGAQLAEAHLASALGLDGAAGERMWLRKAVLRAGLTPQEDLIGLPASARRVAAEPVGPGLVVSVVDTQVGAMRARLEIEHDASNGPARPGRHASIDDVLGPAADRYFGTGFQTRGQLLDDVEVTADAATASVGVDGDRAWTGLGAGYGPGVSFVDCFVVCLQLAQVLMYRMDRVARGESNTLWMLNTTLSAARAARPWERRMPARTAIRGSHLLAVRGGTWRNVDIDGELGGVELRSSLAHELPADRGREGNGR